MSGENILLVLLDALLCCQDLVNLLWWVKLQVLRPLPPFEPRHAHAGSEVGIQIKNPQNLLDTVLVVDVYRLGWWYVHRLLCLSPYSVPSWVIYVEILPFRIRLILVCRGSWRGPAERRCERLGRSVGPKV